MTNSTVIPNSDTPPAAVTVSPAQAGASYGTLRQDHGHATTPQGTYRYAVTLRVVDRVTGRTAPECVVVSVESGDPARYEFVGSAYARGVAPPAQMWLPVEARDAAWVVNDGLALSGMGGAVADVVGEVIGRYEARRATLTDTLTDTTEGH